MTGAIADLRREVLGGPLCAACGACVGLCPYVVAVGDRVACVEECRKEIGRCYRYCPRSGAVGADVTADARDSDAPRPLGVMRYVRLARAVDPPESGLPAPGVRQHGGVVSALLSHALRSAMIDTAVLAGGTEGVAAPASVTRVEEVAACAGSKFGLAPTVAEVNRALNQGARRVGVVALPCQATALRRMRDDVRSEDAAGATEDASPGSGPVADGSGVSPAEGVTLVVGLFCTWALGQGAWRSLLEQHVGSARVMRADIAPPPADVLIAELEDGARVEIPLDDVRLGVRPACRVCADMTAEHADISAGMAEGDPGWNTVIVRTSRGERLLDQAVEAGTVEVCEPAAVRVQHLAEASVGKKRRAAAEAGRWEGDAPYLLRLREARGR